jgi:gliding motility-associated-like protein
MKKYIPIFFVQFFLCTAVHSQLCTGSLGDPVVNITFGDYLSPRDPLKAGVTNLKYVAGCPGDGEYTITSFSFGCFGNTWQYLVKDHTGDLGGRFMVVNASFEPSDFYVDTVTGLCGNTVYELATWVANILLPTSCNGAGIKPNLTFRIETISGTVLKKFDSGDIPEEAEKTWKQYGTFFSTPTGVSSVVLRITNNAKGGCGNDLILDDITFRPCGPKVTAHPDNDTSNNISLCENMKNDLRFTASYSNTLIDPVLQWQIWSETGKTWVDIAGEKSTTYTRKATGVGSYLYRVVIAERSNFGSAQCRIASNVTNIYVAPVPDGPTLTNVLGCTNTNKKIDAIQGLDLTYQWSGPNGFTAASPSILLIAVTYRDSGLYKVVATTNFNCIRTDTFHLKVFPGSKAIVSADASVCEGKKVVLTASGGITYDWSPAAGLSDAHSPNPVASAVDTTIYKIMVTNQFGCKDSAFTTVNVLKKPKVNAGPDSRIYEGESVSLQGQVSGTSISFSWSPTSFMLNSNSLSPIVNPNDKITYTLYGYSNVGCDASSDEVTIFVYKKVRAPNTFSPNGDGMNDTWVITGLDSYPDAVLTVYSRDGKMVFQTRGSDKIWDGTFNGKPVPVGTYYYLIDLNTGQPVLSGWILIIR